MGRTYTDSRNSSLCGESLSIYMHEISRSQVLSSRREAELAVRIRQGDLTALQDLVKANLRFVVSVSRNYQNQGLPLSDLINEGNLGLIKAAKRFDERKNFRFISYAVWWIRQAILQALAEQSRIMKLPLNRVGTIHKIGKVQNLLEQRLKRLPNHSEIARELRVEEREVCESLRIGRGSVSLDTPLQDCGDSRLMDTLGALGDTPDHEVMVDAFNKEVHDTLDTLDERERAVIRLYYGIGDGVPCTLEEIGVRLNLTRERVRQIKGKALRKLRHFTRWRRLTPCT